MISSEVKMDELGGDSLQAFVLIYVILLMGICNSIWIFL